MYNATNAATWLNTPSLIALRLAATLLRSSQRYDLFVTSLLDNTLRRLTQGRSTQRFVCYLVSHRSAPLFNSARRSAAHIITPQRNATN